MKFRPLSKTVWPDQNRCQLRRSLQFTCHPHNAAAGCIKVEEWETIPLVPIRSFCVQTLISIHRRPPGCAGAARGLMRRRPYSLVAINCLVFLVMLAHHVSAAGPNVDQLMYWGADNAGSVLIQGQWCRIVTAMFVHVGIIHTGYQYVVPVESGIAGRAAYGFNGRAGRLHSHPRAAGNLLSTFKTGGSPTRGIDGPHEEVPRFSSHRSGSGLFSPGAGASGAVFGIAGALIILLNSHRLPVPRPELKRLRKSVIYFAALNLAIPFFFNFGASAMHAGVRIDSMAHLGGFSCGLLFAAPMVPRIGAPRDLFLFRLRVTSEWSWESSCSSAFTWPSCQARERRPGRAHFVPKITL